MPEVIEFEVEKMARTIVTAGGLDPDTLVQLGDPRVYGTPLGRAFMVMPGAEEPLWRSYVPMARASLALAREQLNPPPKPLSPVEALGAELAGLTIDKPKQEEAA